MILQFYVYTIIYKIKDGFSLIFLLLNQLWKQLRRGTIIRGGRLRRGTIIRGGRLPSLFPTGRQRILRHLHQPHGFIDVLLLYHFRQSQTCLEIKWNCLDLLCAYCLTGPRKHRGLWSEINYETCPPPPPPPSGFEPAIRNPVRYLWTTAPTGKRA